MTIALSGLRGRLTMLTVAAVGFLCAPAIAEAAYVTRDANTLRIVEDAPGPGGIGTTDVQQANVITVTYDAGTDEYVVTDTAANPTTNNLALPLTNRCTAAGNTVRCPEEGITTIQVEAGELADVIDLDDPSIPAGRTSTVNGGTGEDELRGLLAGADTLNGQDDTDTLFGNGGDDALSGGQGTDVLRGGEGTDVLRGGADADDFHGDGGEDTVSYSDSSANVYAKIDPSVKSGAGCVNGGGDGCEGDQINGTVENLTGGSGNDTLIGSENVGNKLVGGGGNDRLEGLSGGDQLDGGAGNDELYGAEGADTLNGDANDDRLQGGADNDVMNGGGQAGDTVDYTDRVFANTDNITVDLNAATPTNGGAKDGSEGARDTITGVNHVDSGDGFDTLTGNGNANIFNTGNGNDTMDGKAGNDTFNAGAGNDSMVGDAGDDVFNAGDGDDTMNGGAGADTFNGGAGERDHVTYVGDPDDADDNAGRVVVTIGTGTGDDGSTNDVSGAVKDTVSGDVEDVTGGPDNDVIRGTDDNDNILHGGPGNDRLDGGTGPDLLFGDAGTNDTVTYDSRGAAEPVVADLDSQQGDDGSAADGVAGSRDTIDGVTTESIVGGAGDDRLSGNELANQLTGGAGNDVLLGGLGADAFSGGGGEDSVVYVDDGRAAGTGVTVSIGDAANDGAGGAAEGDNVGADVENLVGTDSNDTITGDTDANKIFGLGGTDVITGNAGDDVLDGGAGAGDQLDGGSGDDLLHLGSDGTGSDGADSVNGSVDDDTITYATVFITNPTHVLAAFASQERAATAPVRVTLAGTADDGQITPAENDSVIGVENAIGGAGDDELTGTTAANTLDGRSGDDKLKPGNEAGTQSDTLIGGPGAHDLADYSDRDADNLIITLNGEADDGKGGAEGAERDDIRSDVEDVTTGDGADSVTGDPATANRIDTQGGNDVVNTSDTTGDQVFCGAGSDAVTADHRDAVDGCETQTFTSKAQLSVADAQVTEGTGNGNTNLAFKVTVDAAPGTPVTFQYATSEGTATDPEDYEGKSGQGTIEAGQTETTINIKVNRDALDEADETLTLTITSPSANGEIVDGTATGTILDDEGSPTVTIGDAQVDEGNAGTKVVNVPVTLSGASGQPVTVKYSTSDGTATAGSDYTAVTDGTVTIPAGETSANAPVTIGGDTTDEANETLVVTLSAPTNATLAEDKTGTVTITDDDGPPSLSIADASIAEGDAGNKTLSFTVTLSQASGNPVTFTYSTSDGTATAGAQGDYLAATDVPVTIPAGSTTAKVDVTVRGDTAVEAGETFTVTLAGVQNATVTDGTATGTITDDDATPSLSVADVTVKEGDSGTTDATFTITLSQASSKPVEVKFATAGGTAEVGSDLPASGGLVAFTPGTTERQVTVPVNGDMTDEPDETFKFTLSEPSNATLGDGEAIGTITDDDQPTTTPPVVPAISVNDVKVAEGDEGTTPAVFTVTLSKATTVPVTVRYVTSDGTATSGADYAVTAGTLTFAAGETTKTVSVPVTGDRLDEADEAFALALVQPVNATLGKAAGAALITDDESPRLAPRSVSAKVTPSRDRTLPYRFRTSGRVSLPSGVRRSDACAGKVQVRFKAGKKTISTRRVNLRSDCTYSSRVSFGIKSRLRPGKLKVNVRFLGNAVLLPKSAKARFVRVVK